MKYNTLALQYLCHASEDCSEQAHRHRNSLTLEDSQLSVLCVLQDLDTTLKRRLNKSHFINNKKHY